MNKLNIRADRARLAASCMAIHDIRYYLNGIRVEPRTEGGVFLIGTDGHRMMAVIDETGECDEPTILRISPDLLKRMPKSDSGAIKQRLQLEEFRGKPVLVLTDKMTGVLPASIHSDVIVEGKFPDWRRVLPDLSKVKKGAVNCFNPVYLTSALQHVAYSRNYPVRAVPYQAGDNAPIAFHLEGHNYALLIIMPMRDDGSLPTKFTGNFMFQAAEEKKPEAAEAVA